MAPFCVRLDATPLTELLDDAMAAHRIYELMQIERPGDVWRHVRVLPVELPNRARGRIHDFLKQSDMASSDPPSDLTLSYNDFDALFTPPQWDPDPDQETWAGFTGSGAHEAFAKQLLAMAKHAASGITWNDPLIEHVAQLIRENRHAFGLMDRSKFERTIAGHEAYEQEHSADFYKRLKELLWDRDIASVAYRADGDYAVLRAMATEQRRRAAITGHVAGHALHLSARRPAHRRPESDAHERSRSDRPASSLVGSVHPVVLRRR